MRRYLLFVVGVLLLSFAIQTQAVELENQFRDESFGYVVAYPAD